MAIWIARVSTLLEIQLGRYVIYGVDDDDIQVSTLLEIQRGNTAATKPKS